MLDLHVRNLHVRFCTGAEPGAPVRLTVRYRGIVAPVDHTRLPHSFLDFRSMVATRYLYPAGIAEMPVTWVLRAYALYAVRRTRTPGELSGRYRDTLREYPMLRALLQSVSETLFLSLRAHLVGVICRRPPNGQVDVLRMQLVDVYGLPPSLPWGGGERYGPLPRLSLLDEAARFGTPTPAVPIARFSSVFDIGPWGAPEVREKLSDLRAELGAAVGALVRALQDEWGDVREACEHAANVLSAISARDSEYAARLTNDIRVMLATRYDYMDAPRRAICGHIVPGHDMYEDNDESPCEECAYDDEWVRPEDSDEWHPRDELFWSESREAYYTYDIDEDEDEDEGVICGWERNTTSLLPAPEIESTSMGDFTLGVEFECELPDDDERREFAREITANTNRVICKYDGSLSDDGGLELVFAPLRLESVCEEFDSIDFPSGTEAWNAGNCGVHVHVDARAFTQLSFAKFYAFWNADANAAFIRSVAGRHPSEDAQARTYAKTATLSTPLAIVQDLKSGELATNRYYAINVVPLGREHASRLGLESWGGGHHSNLGTVEVRIFRASLRRARFISQVEMVHAAVEYARVGSIRQMTAEHFREWLRRYGARYPTLQRWVGVRKPSTGKRAARRDEAEATATAV